MCLRAVLSCEPGRLECLHVRARARLREISQVHACVCVSACMCECTCAAASAWLPRCVSMCLFMCPLLRRCWAGAWAVVQVRRKPRGRCWMPRASRQRTTRGPRSVWGVVPRKRCSRNGTTLLDTRLAVEAAPPPSGADFAQACTWPVLYSMTSVTGQFSRRSLGRVTTETTALCLDHVSNVYI